MGHPGIVYLGQTGKLHTEYQLVESDQTESCDTVAKTTTSKYSELIRFAFKKCRHDPAFFMCLDAAPQHNILCTNVTQITRFPVTIGRQNNARVSFINRGQIYAA